jgi:hypothetical protein
MNRTGPRTPRPERLRSDHAVPLFEALQSVLGDLAGQAGADLDRVRLAWPRAVGPQIARVTRPVGLEDGALRIEVEGEAWRNVLQGEQRRILGRLRGAVPALTRLRFEVRPGPRPTVPTPPPPEPAPDPRNAQVADPALRRALDELAAARRGTP